MRRPALLAILATCSTTLGGERAVDARLDAGDRAYRDGSYRVAGKLGAEALSDATWRDDPNHEARARQLLGSTLEAQGNPAGQSEHEQAITLARRNRDRGREAAVLAEMGYAAWRRADYTRAQALCEEALALSREAGDPDGEGVVLGYLGRVHFKQGAYHAAEKLHLRALRIARSRRDARGQAVALEDVGLVLRDRWRLPDALARFQEALVLARTAGDTVLTCRLLGDIGILYGFQGLADEGRGWFEEALRVADAARSAPARAGALVLLARSRLSRGDRARALPLLAQALALHEELGDRRQVAWDHAAVASGHRIEGRADQALAHYAKAIEIWENIQDRRALGWHLFEVGRTYEMAGDGARALEMHERALALEDELHLPYRSLTLGSAARLYARSGRRDVALAHGRRAVEAARETGSPELLWSAWYDLGRVESALDLPDDARESLSQALAAIETLRAETLTSDLARAALLEDRQSVFAEAIELLWEQGRIEEALVAAERSRARAFLDLLHERRDGSSAPPPSLPALKREAERRGCTLVEYFCGVDRTYIWVVTPDGRVHGRTVDAPRARVEKLVDDMRRELGADLPTRGDAPLSAPTPATTRNAARELHRLLLAPLSEWLSGDGSLVTIVPHGRLFLLSFAALEDAEGRYLVERHTLSYSPAISVLSELCPRPRSGPRRFLVVGNPEMPDVPGREHALPALPGAEEEADAIAALCPPGSVTVLLGPEAREDRVRALASSYDVLHLATHGLLRDDAPMESLLALAPGLPGAEDRDGRWTAREVAGSRLDVDLVTLSACHSGLGRVTGDGVLGLSRAFLSAGAPRVVVSLWRVADLVGRHEMETFYRTLAQPGVGPAVALRQAQLQMIAALRRGELRTPSGRRVPEHPLYWAPFVLVGDATAR